MTRRIPILATLVVVLAVATMIALGFWQLERRAQKIAALATYRANLARPALPYVADGSPADDARYLFRTVSTHCTRVTDWQVIGGRTRAGEPGWRHIATCVTSEDGKALLVDLGVSATPDVQSDWTGGAVRGRASHEPDHSSFLMRMAGAAPPLRLMIVSEAAAPGLAPSPLPDPSSVPNNHLSYAVQWFSFAAIALVIYVLALRKRWRER